MTNIKRTILHIFSIILPLFLLSGCELLGNSFNNTSIINLSSPGGFYDEPFDLTVTAKNYDLFYTTDGSDPNTNSIHYDGPIHIYDKSSEENIYANRSDTSILYKTGEYVEPDTITDKCFVLRIAAFDKEGNFITETTSSYFIGFSEKTGYYNMNFVSIVTDPDNLFDYDKGIYVLGRTFDEAIANGQTYDNDNQVWFPANYWMKGREWERVAHAEFFGTDGNPLLSQRLGIRVRGHGTRAILPRSLNLYARKDYNDSGFFDADLLNLGFPIKRMTLYGGGVDRSKSKNAFASEILSDRAFLTGKYVPYVMFLNGEYWGVYWLTEKFDETDIAGHYSLDKDDIVYIKDGEIESGEEDDIVLYENLLSFFEQNDLSDPDIYEKACEIVDMRSLLDYYAAEIYISNNDWPYHNFGLWRTRSKKPGKYNDGKWRWVFFDLDADCLDHWYSNTDNILIAREQDIIFDALCNNDDFCQELAITLMDLSNSNLSPDQTDPVLCRYQDLMLYPVEKEAERFNYDETEAAWQNGEYIKAFFQKRQASVEQQISDDLGIPYEIGNITVKCDTPEGGTIYVNTIKPNLDSGQWTGRYFTSIPIELKAEASEGWHFVEWDTGEISYQNNELNISVPSDGIEIKAVFEYDNK
ncbi:MAG: CotH kinase family protein [Lachnospiraceae bacterium]|nr:CotH kinase family protein [Lachnospiraceae bacterium]